MDFMHDGLFQGKTFRSFNVIDDFNREVLTISIDTSLTSQRVIRELDKLIDWRGTPEYLRVDNGPEFTAQALTDCAEPHSIKMKFIEKGKPHQNGYMSDSIENIVKKRLTPMRSTIQTRPFSNTSLDAGLQQ
jgi:putative transposase